MNQKSKYFAAIGFLFMSIQFGSANLFTKEAMLIKLYILIIASVLIFILYKKQL